MKIAKKLLDFSAQRLKDDRPRALLLAAYLIFTAVSSAVCFFGGQIRNGLLPLCYAAVFLLLTAVAECLGGIRCGKVFLTVLYCIPVGGILGTCFDLYTHLVHLDTLLHLISGFVFAALGYGISEALTRRSGKNRVMSLLLAICFSLAVALCWELLEWGLTVLTNGDMLEDTVIRDIRSYLLSGSHNESVDILGIDKTVIYYSGGEYVIDGYLDVGLTDTLTDMLVCFIGDVIFLLVAIFGCLSGKDVMRFVAPVAADD